jgi:cyclopropane-fatty-acyl-phospholipid synthase
MAQYVSKTEDRGAARTAKFVERLLRDVEPRDFAVELWDHTRWNPDSKQFHRFTWKINNSEAVSAVFGSSNRQLALGEAYVRGDFDIEGDIEAVFPLADYLIAKKWSVSEKLFFAGYLGEGPFLLGSHRGPFDASLSPVHSKNRDRKAIHYHYDVSNEFYQLWLDRNMMYSAAYYSDFTEDLDTAQLQKLDLICSKLCLTPGERLVDIGCGWGGLIIHAARNYGVEAVGITLSEAQARFAEDRIREAGISDRCRVQILDYRDLHKLGFCDKLVSVGMIEHVGVANLQQYFLRAFQLLRPGGLFLNSGIGITRDYPVSDQPTFTDVYVFPDGELEPIGTLLSNAEHAGFEVREVENLREHYDLTTRQWLRRLEANATRARELVGEERYRIWRLYLAGSAYYFRRGWLGLYHSLLRKNRHDGSSALRV